MIAECLITHSHAHMSSPSAEAPSSGSFSSSPSAPPPAAAAAAACSSSGALVVFQVNGLVLTLSPLAKAVKGGGGGGMCNDGDSVWG